MKKHLITGLFAALALTANAQSFKEWLDPEINAVNRAPMHTNYFAYESADAAMQGKKAQSTNYMTLTRLRTGMTTVASQGKSSVRKSTSSNSSGAR